MTTEFPPGPEPESPAQQQPPVQPQPVPPAQQQPEWQGPAPQPAPRRTLFARPVATGLIGVLVGAFLVGVPWLVLGLLGGPSAQPLKAPDTLGGYLTVQAAVTKIDKGGAAAKSQIERADKADRENTTRISEAYGGAAAVSRTYNDEGLLNGFQLTAVRADSPSLIAPYEDATALGLAAPSTELVQVGAVQCLLHNDPTPLGQQQDPESSFATACQRTGAGLTVTLRTTARDTPPTPEKLAAVVEEAWTALGS